MKKKKGGLKGFAGAFVGGVGQFVGGGMELA